MNNREDIAKFIESAILGTEGRRGVWTDRDYLVAVLTMLTGDGDRGRNAAVTAPFQLMVPNLKYVQDTGMRVWYEREDRYGGKVEKITTVALNSDDLPGQHIKQINLIVVEDK